MSKTSEQAEKKMNVSTKRVLQYIWQEYKVFPKLTIANLLTRVIVIVIEVLPALYYKDLVNLFSNVVANTEIAAHGITILMYIFRIKLSSVLLRRLNDYVMVPFEQDMQEDLYNKIFDYFQRHSTQFFADNFTGSLISKIRKCIGSFERFTDTLNFEIVPFVLNVVIILIIVGQQNPWIAGCLCIVIVLSI
ncbi:MAG: hypothetical protein LBP53_07900 [Candidatus Peribacteria bacterium]|jgi:ABC-type multidrug transport system fused ATPase/permease subunit|nr:hypothetical protein [Candidatus Peribacteria bacterium]